VAHLSPERRKVIPQLREGEGLESKYPYALRLTGLKFGHVPFSSLLHSTLFYPKLCATSGKGR